MNSHFRLSPLNILVKSDKFFTGYEGENWQELKVKRKDKIRRK